MLDLGALAHAAKIIRDGGVVAYATEHCFGLGCDPFDTAAVRRLLEIKRRPAAKGLILLAGDIAQLEPYTLDVPAHVRATWPGPHTWLLTPRHVPYWITGRHTSVAARVTAHAQAAALCRAAGHPIVSTSANRAGEKPTRSYRDTVHRLGTLVDYVLPGAVGHAAAPTPIRDAATRALVRPG